VLADAPPKPLLPLHTQQESLRGNNSRPKDAEEQISNLKVVKDTQAEEQRVKRI